MQYMIFQIGLCLLQHYYGNNHITVSNKVVIMG
jgi:hypothetical protein